MDAAQLSAARAMLTTLEALRDKMTSAQPALTYGHLQDVCACITAAQVAGIASDNAEPPTYATDEQIFEARAQYGSDDIEIDDMRVLTSRGDNGTWIAAWVWLADDETDDEEE